MECAYAIAVPWHDRKSTAATPATKRRADLETRNMVRILAAQPFERKRGPAAGLIWINIAVSASEHYYRLDGVSDVLDRHALGNEEPPRFAAIEGYMAAFATRKVLKRLAQLTAGLLLFTQLVLAAHACMMPQPNPAHAFSDAMTSGECEGVPMDRATCLADCLKTDQASFSAKVHFDVILPPASPVAELAALRQVDHPAILAPAPYCPSGPPLQILFCSFQT